MNTKFSSVSRAVRALVAGGIPDQIVMGSTSVEVDALVNAVAGDPEMASAVVAALEGKAEKQGLAKLKVLADESGSRDAKKLFSNVIDYIRAGALSANDQSMEKALVSYLAAALWTNVDDDQEPLDKKYDIKDIADDSVEKARQELASFMSWIEEEGVDVGNNDEEQIAHDFYLTREHHGAGFWDGDYPNKGKRLTDMAHSFGLAALYVGDDGKLHFT